MLLHGMARRQRQGEPCHQQRVDPRMHFEAPLVGALDQAGQGIEVHRLSPEQRAAGRLARVVERVAAATHLHEQGVEAGPLGVVDDPIHVPRRHEPGPHDP